MMFYFFPTCIVLCIPSVKHLFQVVVETLEKWRSWKSFKCLYFWLWEVRLLTWILTVLKGEPGQNSLKGPSKNLEATVKDFEKKFKDKTKNNWKDRADFKPCAGKYTLIEMDAQDDDENAQMEEKVRSFLGIIVFVCLFVCLFVCFVVFFKCVLFTFLCLKLTIRFLIFFFFFTIFLSRGLIRTTIFDALRDLVPFVQLKKREKRPWRSVAFNKVAGW